MVEIRPYRRPRILLVGPFERDNLGDLLFLLVTERYLGGAQTVAAAPFAGSTSALLGREVRAFDPLLERESFDAIWSVGGQLGGVDLHRAYRMAASPDEYRAFLACGEAEQAAFLQRSVGGQITSPYIPAPLAYVRNAGAIGVVNSAGLSTLRRAAPQYRAGVTAILRGQTLVSVRDTASSHLLETLDIAHTLAPDAVHAMGVLRPAPAGGDSDVAIFQASSAILRTLGRDAIADVLAHARHLRGLRLRLLPAGVATGHDRFDDYERLARRVRQLAPHMDVDLIRTRQPHELVDHIAAARVVVASSLHMRVLAAAYGVARVSLERHKPTQYARTWDARMPYSIRPEGLDDAIGDALRLADDSGVRAEAQDLSRRAHEHLGELAETVLALARSQSAADRAQRADERRHHQLAFLTGQVLAQEAELARLRGRAQGDGAISPTSLLRRSRNVLLRRGRAAAA
jgi:Polysaccharide pyruvyl transferase